MPNKTELIVKFGDIPTIRDLIASLTEVAAAANGVIEGWDADLRAEQLGQQTEDAITDLRNRILDLNTYIDDHFDDE